MKKIMLLISFLALSPVYSYAQPNGQLAVAIGQLSSAAAALESALLQLSQIPGEETALQAIRSSMEKGISAIKDVLELYTTQGDYTPETGGMLTEASLDGIDLLTRIQQELKSGMGLLTDQDAINIVEECISAIENAKNALEALQNRISEIEAKKSGG